MSQKPWGPRRQARARRILKRRMERPDAPGEFLLPLRLGEEISVAGSLDVRVLRGSVEIWGATLRPSSEFTHLVAPAWAALPRVRAVAEAASNASPVVAVEEPEDVRRFLEEHSSAVVLCLALRNVQLQKKETSMPTASARLISCLLPPLAQPRLRVHKVWPSLLDRLVDLHAAIPRPSSLSLEEGCLPAPLAATCTVLVMGAKGVGKSSCCRYFVNALLGHMSEVCYLETDLGQPELGAPGNVSLYRVRSPLLQVPHSEQHSHECLGSFFAGGVTPSVHPEAYVRCVRAAFNEYQKVCSAYGGAALPPLVVNSHGWASGLGFELTRTVLEIVGAQLVVRLQTAPTPAKRQLEDSAEAPAAPTPAPKRARTALARCGPLALGLRAAAGTEGQSSSGYVLVDVQSVVAADSASSQSKPAADSNPAQPHKADKTSISALELRWLRFACYFRPDMDPCESPQSVSMRNFLSPVPLLRLSLSTLSFGLMHSSISPSEVDAAFTGTVVALCEVSSPSGVMQGDEPSVLAEPEAQPARCMALAFVHAFDFAKRELVVHTPASAASLAKVNAVLRGDIAWEPHNTPRRAGVALTAGPWQPYFCAWSLEEMGAGTRVISTRGNVMRKRLLKRAGGGK